MRYLLIVSLLIPMQLFAISQASLERKAFKNPSHIQHQFNLAEHYRLNGQCEKALPIYRKRIFNRTVLLTPVMLSMAKCFLVTGQVNNSHYVINILLTHNISDQVRVEALSLIGSYPIHYSGISVMPTRVDKPTPREPKKVNRKSLDGLPTDYPVFYTVIPYVAQLSYSQASIKSKGTILGGYLSRTSNYKTLELFFETTSIDYKKGLALKPLSQKNMGAFYSLFSSLSFKHRFGAHYISTTDVNSDGGMMGTYSLFYYPTVSDQYAIDFYGTLFPSYNDNGVGVVQVSPSYTKFSLSFDYFIRAAIIKPNAQVETRFGETKSLFYTVDLGFSYKWLKSKIELTGSFGERIFAIDNSGLNLYNTTEVFTSIYKVAYSITLSKSFFMVGSYSKSFFYNLGSGDKGNSNAASILLGFNF